MQAGPLSGFDRAMGRGASMKASGMGGWILALGLISGASWPLAATGQAAASGEAASHAVHHRHHRHRTARQGDQVIPRESQGPSAPAPDETAAQRAADARLLQQQQAQSAQAATITNQVVEQAEKQRQAVQREVRIQDAPGPAQTGVVPAAGPPVAPVNADDRIQDAPGPAQTIAPLPATVPAAQQQPAQQQPAQTPANAPR